MSQLIASRRSFRVRLGLSALAAVMLAPAASGALVVQSTNQVADFAVSNSDLLQGSTPNPVAAANIQENSSAVNATLVDGAFGTKGDKTTSVTPANGNVITFTLAATAPVIKQIVTYSGWPDGGRDDQRYTVAYSTAASPGTFIDIATANFAVTGNAAADAAQRVTIFDDAGGNLATNVAALRFTFTPNQENGYTGYREFDAFSTPAPEPATLGLVAIGGLAALGRRRRNSRHA